MTHRQKFIEIKFVSYVISTMVGLTLSFAPLVL